MWDPKKANNGMDKPIKENDHCMDAVRYFVKTMHLVKRDIYEEEDDGEGSSQEYDYADLEFI